MPAYQLIAVILRLIVVTRIADALTDRNSGGMNAPGVTYSKADDTARLRH
nr:hypothetical protein [uncultured Celeribacter sp.]